MFRRNPRSIPCTRRRGRRCAVRGHGRERVRDELLLGDDRRVGRGSLSSSASISSAFFVLIVAVAADVGFDVGLFQDDVAVHDRLDGAAGPGTDGGDGGDPARSASSSIFLLGDDLLRQEPSSPRSRGDRSLRRSLRRLHGFSLDGLGRRGPPRRVRHELLEAGPLWRAHMARKPASAVVAAALDVNRGGAGSEPSPPAFAFCPRTRARISFSRSARSRIFAASSSFRRLSSTRSVLRSESQFLNEGYFSRSTLHPSLCPASFLRVGLVPYARRFFASVFNRRVSSKDTDIWSFLS